MKYVMYIGLFLFSCQSGSLNEDRGLDNSSKMMSSKVTNCFEQYKDDYDRLLTKEDIAEVVNIDEASYELETSAYGSAQYQWNSDRPELEYTISGHTISGPDRNRIEIKNLSFYDLSDINSTIGQFEIGYKMLSEEEHNKMLSNIEQQFKEDPKGLSDAKKFLDARLESYFEPLEGLGTKAYWKWNPKYGLQLHVLLGKVTFTIECKLSTDMDDNLKLAEQLARKVMEKCI